MNKKQAVDITGGLSNPSKMPGKAFGIPAIKCKVGSKLRQVPGSTCSKCYALKGMYVFSVVKNAQQKRFDLLVKAMNDPAYGDLWVRSMVFLIGKQKYFRWHDSGDLQGHRHLDLICQVCRETPNTQHWLPTREYQMVNTYLGSIPNNLVVRLSAHMIDARPPSSEFTTSTVHKESKPYGKACHARNRGGHCGLCRACWNPKVANVSYPIH